jgi:hypothetical protein
MADQSGWTPVVAPAGWTPVGTSSPSPAPVPAKSVPSQDDGDVILQNIKNAGHLIYEGLPTIGGAIAGGLGAMAGPEVAIPLAGLGGMAGQSAKTIIGRLVSGDFRTPMPLSDTAKDIALEGGKQALIEGAGALAGAGAQVIGRGLYKAGVRPAARLLDKSPDLIETGLREAIPVGGSKVAQERLRLSKNAADQLVNTAATNGPTFLGGPQGTINVRTIPTSDVTNRFQPIVDSLERREALGVDPSRDLIEVATREAGLNAAHPNGIDLAASIPLKREADTLANTAQNQLRRGVAPTDTTARLDEATRAALADAQRVRVPGLAEQNAKTQNLYGLSRALRAAENRPHALTDMASIASGVAGAASGGSDSDRAERGMLSGLAFRVLSSPAVQSRAGIASYALGAAPLAQAIRAAVMARLASETPTEGSSQR